MLPSRPIRSPSRCTRRRRAGASAPTAKSTWTWPPWCSTHGAATKVVTNSAYSTTSTRPRTLVPSTVRANTSHAVASAITANASPAIRPHSASTRSYMRLPALLREQLAHHVGAFRRGLPHVGPPCVERGRVPSREFGPGQRDRPDARLGLPLDLGGVDLRVAGVALLDPLGGLRQHRTLRVGQLLPAVEVDQDVHVDLVEARVDAVPGLLLPAEVEDALDRPAVAVDDAALERGVDLAGRGLHQVRTQLGEERA